MLNMYTPTAMMQRRLVAVGSGDGLLLLHSR